MMKYQLSASDRRALEKHNREFGVLIMQEANRVLGCELDLGLLSHLTNSLLVNGKFISVKSGSVADITSKSPSQATPEERAVVDAIHNIADQFRKNGAEIFDPLDCPNEYVSPYLLSPRVLGPMFSGLSLI